MTPVVKIENLQVSRSKDFQLDINRLNVVGGKILGVAGPNGSGKTTFLEAITGIAKIDGGRIWLSGKVLSPNLRRLKAVLGYIPDDEGWLVPELSAKEYFKLLQKVYKDAGRPVTESEIAKLAKHLQFTAFDQRLDSLSHGNKKKVQIIAGLMHRPEIIVIDELRNGLDPIVIIAAERLIKRAAAEGAAVIAATHDLWWAQRITDELLLLSNGRPLVYAPTKNLVARYGSLEKLFSWISNGRLVVPKI